MVDEYLAEVFRVLYPEPYRLELPGGRGGAATGVEDAGAAERHEPLNGRVGEWRAAGRSPAAEYVLLPSAARPRLAVPAGPRRQRLAALDHLRWPEGTRERVRNRLARALLAVAVPPFSDRVRVRGAGDNLPGYLSVVLGRPVTCAVHLGGPLRANRKPVLELLDPDGAPLGFAKVGAGELTAALVRAEARALTRLSNARLRLLTVPELRWHGRWRDRDVLVQQALPVWRQAGLRRGAAVARAMVELSGACGLAVAPFGESAYHDRLLRRLEATAGFGTGPGTGIPAGTGAGDRAIGRAAVPGQESVGRALWRAGREAFAKAGGLCLTFGAWHGDWTPWNTHVTGDAVLVWDWERFATGVPVGMDALHWRFQSMVDAGTPASVSAAALPHQAARLLDPFGVPPAAARFTALLYLLDMGARYLADGLDTRPQRLGDLASWLLPVVARETGLDLGTGRTPAPGQPGAPGGPGAVVGARGEG